VEGLTDRRSECGVLDQLLSAVRAGDGRALVVHGEAGVGKTALLDYLARRAAGCRAVRVAGVQSEMELAFAGLHRLCAPVMNHLDRLPAPQRDALRISFGLSAGPAPDHFLVGLAVLGLLSEAAGERPLICLIDDAPWLDRASAQVLGFVARRLSADAVGLLFGARVPGEELAGLPELMVEGLSPGDARALLDSVLTGPLDDRVRDRIVTEARGNPLALLELPRGLSPAELAGFEAPEATQLSGRIEESFRQQLDALPGATRRLLQLAAADPTGDPSLVWQAANRLGLPVQAAVPAAEALLVEFGARIVFRHPLIRSAAYRSASLLDRQNVHRALAEATDPAADPDRRAWHQAQAADGPDEDVAAGLERSARQAQARGGLTAAAAFLERSALLTVDPARRTERMLAAAQANLQAGALDRVLELLVTAEAGSLDEFASARVDLLRGQVAYARNRGSDAVPLLLQAARRLEPLDVRLARVTYLDALSCAFFAGGSAGGVGVVEVAQSVLAAPRPSHRPGPLDLLLDGVATQVTEGYAASVPILKRALTALRSQEFSAEERLECGLLTYYSAVDLWDDESWYVLAGRNVTLARESGALMALQFALNARIVANAFMGELTEGYSLLAELRAVCEATGSHVPPYSPLALVTWRGREAEVSRLAERTTEEVLQRGETLGLSAARWAIAVLYNGLGRHEEALAAALRAGEHHDIGFSDWSLAELILAAVRCGKPERAAGALKQFAAKARDSGSDWALGIAARSRALLSEGETAEDCYRESIDRLGRTRIRVELARSHLLYGEWLRHERRRGEAREQLGAAHQMLDAIGIEAFCEVALRELRAAGETVTKRTAHEAHGGTAGARDALTAQEAQVARLARDGLSNPEIAARLFISTRTVQYHLGKVFAKLGISSRGQLHQVLPSEQL
jgi:DNA-binding CsgD family transcriptional regulator